MGGTTAAMDPPPNAPRSPNGRDFAARAEGERMVLKNTPMGRAPQVKREMREEDASSGGGPATATRSGQAKRAARAANARMSRQSCEACHASGVRSSFRNNVAIASEL